MYHVKTIIFIQNLASIVLLLNGVFIYVVN